MDSATPSFCVLGVRIHATNIPAILAEIDRVICNGQKGYITITGVHGIVECQNHPQVWHAHEQAWLTVPDGMPLVYIGRLHGRRHTRRCYGPDLMLAVMDKSRRSGWTHFFYGGKPGVAQELREEMERRFPGVQILGTYSPPFRPLSQGEREALVHEISQLQPDIFWVGLSTPKQELFMHEYLSLLNTKIMIGVGAAFDFHTGRVRQAPRWMQSLALEWLFRTFAEPKRLFRRYARIVPMFLFLYSLQLLGLREPNSKPKYMEDLAL